MLGSAVVVWASRSDLWTLFEAAIAAALAFSASAAALTEVERTVRSVRRMRGVGGGCGINGSGAGGVGNGISILLGDLSGVCGGAAVVGSAGALVNPSLEMPSSCDTPSSKVGVIKGLLSGS